MQVIEPSHYIKKEKSNFRRDLLLGAGLSVGGLVIFMLPLTGFLPNDSVSFNLGFWGLVLLGLGLMGTGSRFGWLAWLYYDEQLLEERVINILARVLNEDYKYLRDLNSLANRPIIGSGSTNEVGGVLLGPHGAWVLQICRYRGVYACEGDTWYKYSHPQNTKPQPETEMLLAKRRLDDSPNWQVIRAAREVKAWLSVRELPQLTVQPIVILARGKIRFSKRPSCPIVELWYLETYLKNTLVATAAFEVNSEPVSGEVVNQIMERLRS